MKNPIKHHYVPQVYLQSFADSQKEIYQLNKQYRKISKKSISGICYQPDYFTLKRDDTRKLNRLNDPYHIERNAFKIHENVFGKLLKKITKASLSPFTLPMRDVKLFLEILVTIKRRNPVIRQTLSHQLKEYINSKAFKNQVASISELAKRVDGSDALAYLEKYKNEVNNDPSHLHDAYLSNFLNAEQKLTENIINTLMAHKVFIHHAAIGNQFLTSDNPGFVVVNDIVISHGGLSDAFLYSFPLTPSCCLFIDASEKDHLQLIDKTIYIRHVDPDAVELTNRSTASVATKIFSYGKKHLEIFLKNNPNM